MIDPEQEDAWAQHKAECYARWRAQKLKSAARWLRQARSYGEREQMLKRIERQYSRAFAADLRTLANKKRTNKRA